MVAYLLTVEPPFPYLSTTGIAPPGMNTTCADTLSCPAPMYFMGGVYQGEYSNNAAVAPIPDDPSDNFGLDEVEPRFFHPLGDWESYGIMETYLTFDMDFPSDFFYFCSLQSWHLHLPKLSLVLLSLPSRI